MQKNIWIAAKYLRLSIEDGDKAESEIGRASCRERVLRLV